MTEGGGPWAPADDDAFDRLRRRVLWAMPSGLFVLGSAGAAVAGVRPVNLMTANWVGQVATSPKMVAASVEASSRTRALLDEGGVFTVSLLSREDRAHVRRFVKPVADIERSPRGELVAMAAQEVFEAPSGPPVLSAALGWLECGVRHRLDLGSHVLYVGEVIGAGERSGEALAPGTHPDILSMRDTKMNYGG